jgi:hypothetical protein
MWPFVDGSASAQTSLSTSHSVLSEQSGSSNARPSPGVFRVSLLPRQAGWSRAARLPLGAFPKNRSIMTPP